MLWQDVLEEDLIDQLGGAGLSLVLLQLFLPSVVQQMNVFVLSVEQPEVDEEPREEGEVRLVPVPLVSCPDLITETLGLPTTIIESNMFVL